MYLHLGILGRYCRLNSSLIFSIIVVLWYLEENGARTCNRTRTPICERLCAGGQQSRICDQSFQLGQGSSPDAVVFIIRFYWDSASATGCLYSAGTAECHIQSAHFVFKEVVISWQVLKQLGPKCTNFP